MEDNMTYLDTYVLQKDMRVRLPKAILENLKLKKGESMFDIFYDGTNKRIVLAIHNDEDSE